MTYKIRYNKRNKRYVVFKVDPMQRPSWRIKRSFKTKKEAEDYIEVCE